MTGANGGGGAQVSRFSPLGGGGWGGGRPACRNKAARLLSLALRWPPRCAASLPPPPPGVFSTRARLPKQPCRLRTAATTRSNHAPALLPGTDRKEAPEQDTKVQPAGSPAPAPPSARLPAKLEKARRGGEGSIALPSRSDAAEFFWEARPRPPWQSGCSRGGCSLKQAESEGSPVGR